MASFRSLTLVTPDQRQLRAGLWELPPGENKRAICVLLNGHGEFLEKYEEVALELRARGFDVVSLDWRGQGASERRSYGNRSAHVSHFEEYDSDLAALLLQAVEPIQRLLTSPLPVIALAHSMGAHILLRFLHEHKRRFVCAALVAPMLDIDTGKYSPAMVEITAALFNFRKPSTRLVFGTEDRDPLELKFEDNVVTKDRGRYERTMGLLKEQPFLRIFGPTFGWLGAAMRSMRRVRKDKFAEGISTPLLVIGAGHDRIVKTEITRDYVKHLPKARYVELEESEHEILMEQDSIRARFWAEFDSFVDEQLSV